MIAFCVKIIKLTRCG